MAYDCDTKYLYIDDDPIFQRANKETIMCQNLARYLFGDQLKRISHEAWRCESDNLKTLVDIPLISNNLHKHQTIFIINGGCDFSVIRVMTTWHRDTELIRAYADYKQNEDNTFTFVRSEYY